MILLYEDPEQLAMQEAFPLDVYRAQHVRIIVGKLTTTIAINGFVVLRLLDTTSVVEIIQEKDNGSYKGKGSSSKA